MPIPRLVEASHEGYKDHDTRAPGKRNAVRVVAMCASGYEPTEYQRPGW